MADRKTASREDDFRDYEQRDIRDGWPYSDSDGGRDAGKNAPYGTGETNLDHRDDQGLEVTDATAIDDVSGAPLPFADDEEDIIDDDDLEERITNTLEADGRFDVTSLEITVRGGRVHLDGAVDSEADRRHLVALLLRMKGIREVEARDVMTRGVDSHIPRDVDE